MQCNCASNIQNDVQLRRKRTRAENYHRTRRTNGTSTKTIDYNAFRLLVRNYDKVFTVQSNAYQDDVTKRNVQ